MTNILDINIERVNKIYIVVVLFSIYVQISQLYKSTVIRERTGENSIIRTIFCLWRHDLLSVKVERRWASINSFSR